MLRQGRYGGEQGWGTCAVFPWHTAWMRIRRGGPPRTHPYPTPGVMVRRNEHRAQSNKETCSQGYSPQQGNLKLTGNTYITVQVGVTLKQ